MPRYYNTGFTEPTISPMMSHWINIEFQRLLRPYESSSLKRDLKKPSSLQILAAKEKEIHENKSNT